MLCYGPSERPGSFLEQTFGITKRLLSSFYSGAKQLIGHRAKNHGIGIQNERIRCVWVGEIGSHIIRSIRIVPPQAYALLIHRSVCDKAIGAVGQAVEGVREKMLVMIKEIGYKNKSHTLTSAVDS